MQAYLSLGWVWKRWRGETERQRDKQTKRHLDIADNKNPEPCRVAQLVSCMLGVVPKYVAGTWCRIVKNQTWRKWFAIVTKTLYFKLVRLKVGYVELGQAKLMNQVRLKEGWAKLSQDEISQVELSQVELGQVKLGQVEGRMR